MAALLLTLIVAYLLLIGLLAVFQRKLMYYPNRQILPPEQYGLSGFGEFTTRSEDGLAIQLWYRPANPQFPTVVYYHGNAYHLGNRANIFRALAEKGFGVLAVSYRGYGKSEGQPNERGIYADARAALRFLTGEQHIPLSRILLYGESLGTGVAVHMAEEHQGVAGLILQAAYTSVINRAAEIYRYIPVRFLIRDHYDSIGKIANVKAPLLLFHGELDTTIPIAHGRALFATATSTKKSFFFPQTAHNDFDSATISAHVLEFAKEHQLIG